MSKIELYHGDCLEVMDRLIEQGVKVDAIITDPPYGTIKNIGESDSVQHGMAGKTEWDIEISSAEIFNRCNKLLREKGVLALFGQEPYTNNLITNAHKNIPFSYRMIWEKDHFANALTAKKAPLNYFEDINIFFRKYDTFNENPLREYFKNVMNYIGLNLKEINKKLGHRRSEHSFYIESTQFSLCTNETYNELTEVFNLKSMKNFKTFIELDNTNKKYTPTFNLWDGNKVKSNILKYKKDYKGYHPTQKPIKLMEDLILTYTNEGDTVLDFTFGSGTTGLACKNLNRNFIGIELDETYFKIAEERILGNKEA